MATTPKSLSFVAQQIRKARGSESQENLAWRVREVSKGTLTPAPTDISRYERGVHAPRMAMLVAIAKATGKDIEFFLNESEEADDDEEAALQTLASQAVELGRYDMAENLLALARQAGIRKLVRTVEVEA
jgi:transcriptional regulator with XRE-family HTH domain